MKSFIHARAHARARTHTHTHTHTHPHTPYMDLKRRQNDNKVWNKTSEFIKVQQK